MLVYCGIDRIGVGDWIDGLHPDHANLQVRQRVAGVVFQHPNLKGSAESTPVSSADSNTPIAAHQAA